ncbi:MAG: class A beta-lactamase-related serine hydrolase, partial [Sphingobacteriaceae bacterium]
MKRIILLTLLIGLTVQQTFPQSFDKTKLDNYFMALETSSKFIGSIAIAKNGTIIYTKQIGYADLENKIKPSADTKYRIGSISKMFTTVLVFKAIEEGKFKLTDNIDPYFPAIKNAGKITIGDLLYHRSGIHNFTANEDYLKSNTEKKSEQEMTQIITKGGSDFEPDTKSEYSNSNFVLLSYLLQKVYKKDYAQLLNERIVKPLGLKQTYYGKKINLANGESYSYSFKGSWVKEVETDMSIPMGAGAVVSTPSDLTKFADALFAGKLVSAPDLEHMKTIKGAYGMGLFKVPFGELSGYGHTGGIDGFSSFLYHFADGDISVAMTSNGTNFDNNQIAIVLLSAVYNKPYDVPTFKTFELTSAVLDQYLGIYVSKQIPLKITVTKNDKILIAQATDQHSFALEATEKD